MSEHATNQELVHQYGQTVVQIVEWIRRCDAPASTKLAVLSRIADVADILRARLTAEVRAGEGKP